MHVRLVDRLAELGRGAGEPVVLADRPDGTVVRSGEVVAKAHAPGSDRARLEAQLAVAAHPLLEGILLTPLAGLRGPLDGRYVTLWPYGVPVPPDDPDGAPWRAAGRLAARLHAVPRTALPGLLPPMGGPANAAHAIARLRATGPVPGADPVLRAWDRLPGWARGEAPGPGHPGHPGEHRTALCHGDLHLGQLVRHPVPGGAWHLIDIDDLGLGEPAWDLARPAAGYATGLISGDDWADFLTGYREAGGPAVTAASGHWPEEVDAPARALTVQMAARALADAAAGERELDEADVDLVTACARIADLPPGP